MFQTWLHFIEVDIFCIVYLEKFSKRVIFMLNCKYVQKFMLKKLFILSQEKIW